MTMACNIHQFNGFYSCLQYLNKGEYGIKEKSVLSNTINVIEQCPIDYMHCVLEGVTKN